MAKRNSKKAKFYTPPNVLRVKVGTGGLPAAQIERAQKFIETNTDDFIPFAQRILVRLDKATRIAKEHKPAGRQYIELIAGPVMEMKASGGMFRYTLASEVASVMLDFLEVIEMLNDDGFNIVDVHQQTLEAIVKKKLVGDGGMAGLALAKELYDACQRYEKKYGVE
jgi:hypothetical protein